MTTYSGNEIAIIGMSGRFPNSSNIKEFWSNLKNGVECITTFTDEELAETGVDSNLLANPNYIKRRGILPDIEMFDALYFDYSPREAELIDPQQRLFLEIAVESLENSGHNPKNFNGNIGLFAGSSMNSYMLSNLIANPRFYEALGIHQVSIANDKDFLTTRTSYKLNLKGPSIAVQTACSTSLVAIHMACQSLLNGESDMAMAGGVSLNTPQKAGYIYQEEGLFSPDGACRAFDSKANGTVGGNGAGIVVLKRLDDALQNKDNILAIIKGSAVNNDGMSKVGFTAPSIQGQSEVIAEALAISQINAESINYIEAHGTGTSLGDPIEIESLNEAFRSFTDKTEFCAIGSVKTNIGHLDAASGVAGLIKTVLSLQNKKIVPSLHYEEPNSNINFSDSPFYVNVELKDWEKNEHPRRAGVSSFGIGGTNAHIILEEAPEREESSESRDWQMLLLSAKTESALKQKKINLLEHIESEKNISLPDISYTLALGHETHDYREVCIAKSKDEIISILSDSDSQEIFSGKTSSSTRPIVFMFPGTGDQYVEMGLELYQTEEKFKNEVDKCAEILLPLMKVDIRDILYPRGTSEKRESKNKKINLRQMLHHEKNNPSFEELNNTKILHPIIFVIEYAMARLLQGWGVNPQAFIGYSLGEYVAACLSGVISLNEALNLVAKRAQLIDELPKGAMLAISSSESFLQPLLNTELSIAAINSETLCVVSGREELISDLEVQLTDFQVTYRRLQTTHAFHSNMMKEIAQPFRELIQTFELKEPSIPYISNVTGTWITAEEATNPHYWARHLTHTVLFEQGIQNIWQLEDPILIEIGPGQGLSSLASQHSASRNSKNRLVLTTIPTAYDNQSDVKMLMTTISRLWVAGIEIDFEVLYEKEKRNKLPLPTYPFERKRFWLEQPESKIKPRKVVTTKKRDSSEWFYIPSWKRSIERLLKEKDFLETEQSWIIFADDYGIGDKLASRLKKLSQTVTIVHRGNQYEKKSNGSYKINPFAKEDYLKLFTDLKGQNLMPSQIYHMFSVRDKKFFKENYNFEKIKEDGFYSLIYLAKAYSSLNSDKVAQLFSVTNFVHDVVGGEKIQPEQSLILGPTKVIGQENPLLKCKSIDIGFETESSAVLDLLTDLLITESINKLNEWEIAYRGTYRWNRTYEAIKINQISSTMPRLRNSGVYLVTGGLGSIGLVLSEFLGQQYNAKIILTNRSAFPQRNEWESWLNEHGKENSISNKILKIKKIEKMGGEVLILRADVSNQLEMENVLSTIKEKFGALNGVIHSAGNTSISGIKPFVDTSPEDVNSHFESKVEGLNILRQILTPYNLDFILLNSSLSPILGGLGFSAYAAANMFMDAFVQSERRISKVPWLSLNWEGWKSPNVINKSHTLGVSTQGLTISSEEALEVFPEILNSDFPPQLIMSTGELDSRLNQWINPTLIEANENSEQKFHSRPVLENKYVKPETDMEKQVANIWREMLGIDQVGLHDNFFQVGGHSLLAVQLLSRIRQFTGIEVRLHDLFEKPTVSALAKHIENPTVKSIQEISNISRVAREKYRIEVSAKDK